jgi:nicotine blue oxidoreductase
MTQFVGLVLAAGEGKRFGQPKASYVLAGERLVDRAVRILTESGAKEVYVVLGAWVDDIKDAKVIVNPNWQTGMGSSLQVGLNQISTDSNLDRVVITLVDLPGLTSAAISKVASATGEIVVATYQGQRGHPVVFTRRHWDQVANSATGDSGARHFLTLNSDLIELVEVGDIATGEDLDFAPDLGPSQY